MSQPSVVFDRMLLRMRRRRAGALGPVTFLIERVAADMAERLALVLRRFELAADLATPTDAVRHALAAQVGAIVAVDAVPEHLARKEGLAVAADEEALPFADASLDLVVSALALQFVNDLPGTLVAGAAGAQARRIVSRRADRRREPDGVAPGLCRR